MIPYTELKQIALAHQYPLLYVTVSGSHLYGFPSRDSDFDMRGAHLLPLDQVVGLEPGAQTIEQMGMRGDLELDLVTYDAARLFQLMLKKNGYILEQILSEHVVVTSDVHQELIEIARNSATSFHAAHYRGFAYSQFALFEKDAEHRVKPILYTFRVLPNWYSLDENRRDRAKSRSSEHTSKAAIPGGSDWPENIWPRARSY